MSEKKLSKSAKKEILIMTRMLFKKTMIGFLVLILAGFAGNAVANDLPVLDPTGSLPVRDGSIRNPAEVQDIIGKIVDGTTAKGLDFLGHSSLQGTIYTGPYPFEAGEADYDYARYRRYEPLTNGEGTLRIDKFFSDKYNANNWPTGQGNYPPTPTIGYRFDIEGLGFYDGVVSFRKEGDAFVKNLTIVEGPFVTMLTSDDPHSMVIAFETDKPCEGTVEVPGLGDFTGPVNTTNHEIKVTGLIPNKNYQYRVMCNSNLEEVHSGMYSFRAAPLKFGIKPISFAFVSDSREGVGGGERNYMGFNFHSLSRLANDAYRRGADLFIFGGDLVNGYTSDKKDFRLQLEGWKQAFAGYWRSRPVYPAMGNHETLTNVFDDGSSYGLSLDKWPYETDSAEAVFAQEFFNPTNGPDPGDDRRPTYKENVYKFQYGPVLFIAFNNNYWWTTNDQCESYGGSPEGYMLDDQLDWIEQVLQDAESDRSVHFVILYAQEPVFPCGGHPNDAMWYYGDNNVKAYQYVGGLVVEAGPGIVDVRNRFWKAIAQSNKVAAVLAGDEHAYHRILIDDQTPVGIPADDDLDDDGVLDQYSPNSDFAYPTWQITAGTGGAPYYAQQDVPWNDSVKFFSSQTGYPLFKVHGNKISMTYYTVTGQKLDHIDNLMAVKKGR
jgi:phosphodiesterase/alkaline phosphatase D-like protein